MLVMSESSKDIELDGKQNVFTLRGFLQGKELHLGKPEECRTLIIKRMNICFFD